MHELAIAEEVLNAIRREAERRGEVRVRKVGLQVGELAGLDSEAFRFCFEAILRDRELQSLELEIEHCPWRQQCSACHEEFLVKNYDLHCPRCGHTDGKCVGGYELNLAYLEVEEHATCGVGPESAE